MSPIHQYVRLTILAKVLSDTDYWEERASTAGCLDIIRQKEAQFARLCENVRKKTQLKAGNHGHR